MVVTSRAGVLIPPNTLAPGPPRPRKRRVPTARRGPERIARWAIVAVGAIGAALSPAQPTGLVVVDALWCGALGGLVTLAASRSRRWPWFWLAGVVAAAAIGTVWIVAGLAALALAFVAAFTRLRPRLLGAAVGALSMQALLRLPEMGFHGLPSLIAAVAMAPVLWSAYDRSNRLMRRRTRRIGLGFAVVVVLALAGAGLAALTARRPLQGGVDSSRSGLEALRSGQASAAGSQFDAATASFNRAANRLTAPWAKPGRLLPVVGQHLDALTGVAESGRTLATAASQAASTADYQQLRGDKGQIDLGVVSRMQGPVNASADALRAARDRVDAISSPWLLGPVSRPLADFGRQIDRTLPEAELASQGLAVSPAIFGGDGVRTYLVLFTTPAETRFLGGFVGAYGVLTADNGKLSFTESGPIGKLNTAPGSKNRALDPDSEFSIRYGRYHVATFMQNITAGPDLPEDAAVARQLYQQTTGTSLDGVIVADPYGLAALLKLTGPVEVEGLTQRLTADNAATYLLKEQYQEDGVQDERRDKLRAASRATFDALTQRSLPSLREVGDSLGPAMRQGHLSFVAFDPAEEHVLDALGSTGRLGIVAGHDYLSVRTANAQANKIDAYLQRSIDYRAEVAPGTGDVTATATVRLTNSAPTTGLPNYVIGNDRGQPVGTTALYLSMYTPLSVTGATVDGVAVGVEPQRELGSPVFSLLVTIPSGATSTVEFQLAGQVDAGAEYHLDLLNQPMANPDQARVTIGSSTDGVRVVAAQSLAVKDGQASGGAVLDTDQRFTVRFARSRAQ